MTVVMIGEEDSAIAFGLIGVASYTAENFEEFRTMMEKFLRNPEVDLIIINDRMYYEHEDYILKLKQATNHPTIVEIQDIIGPAGPDPLDEILKKYVGGV